MLYVSLSGVQVVHGSITIPYSGIWMADVVLTEPKDVTGRQVLQLADTKFSCTVVRAIDFAGARGVRLIGGAAGWRNELPPKQYGSWQVPVQMSVVLHDAASAAKESPVAIAQDRQMPSYIRRKQAASFVLNELLGPSWWMDFDGVVQTKARETTPIASDYVAESVLGAAGIWRIATESVADWTPGRTFKGPTSSGTISRVQHMISKGSLRTVVHSS